MSREILFKAKRTDNGEWVEGNIVLSNDFVDDFEAIIIPITDSNMFTKHVGFKEISCDLGFENWHKVCIDTLCQYTGLTDKNGNKIWENDVVKYKNADGIKFNGTTLTVIGKVVYSEKTAKLAVYGKDEIGGKHCDYFPIKNVEVIGNIFDNPELLGGVVNG